MLLLTIIIFFLSGYAIFFLVLILIEALRKKRVPWVLVGSNVICIAFFIYLQNLVDEHRLIFVGKYQDASMEWGKGMANVYTSLQNNLILILIFSITQVFFWINYKQTIRKMQNQQMLSDLLDKEEEEIPGKG